MIHLAEYKGTLFFKFSHFWALLCLKWLLRAVSFKGNAMLFVQQKEDIKLEVIKRHYMRNPGTDGNLNIMNVKR